MSLLQEMRSIPRVLEERRWKPRTYDANEGLYKYLTPPSVAHAREMRPAAFPAVLHVDKTTGERSYPTRYGKLNKETWDKFSCQLTYTSVTHSEHVQMMPMHKPPDYGSRKFMPKADMVSWRYCRGRYEDGPQEWQKIWTHNERNGLLPELKRWPRIVEEDRMFPVNRGHVEKLYRKVNSDSLGRTEEEQEKVMENIREIVKKDKLMPQYIRPLPKELTFRGSIQIEVRPDEPLERPPDRNPPCMISQTHAVHRKYPAYEYKEPNFMRKGPISCTTTLVNPYNPYNLRFPSLSCKLSDQVPWDKPLYVDQF